MKKIGKGRLTTLMDTMQNDTALTSTAINPDAPVVLQPAHNAQGSAVAILQDWETAFMIMNGLRARWATNYWCVEDRWGHFTGIPRNATLDQWEDAKKYLATLTAKRR